MVSSTLSCDPTMQIGERRRVHEHLHVARAGMMPQSRRKDGEVCYTSEVGRKFYADGRPRTFAGNTIICFVPPDSHIFHLGEWVQTQIRELPYAHKFALLPPSSFHMTVMELLCDEVRLPANWTFRLPLDAPLAQTDQFFINAVADIPPPAAMRLRFRETARRSFAINLEPADRETDQVLRTYRDQVAEATGVRFADHDSYQFHISLAYRLIELTEEEEDDLTQTLAYVNRHLHENFGLFQPPAPQLTFFDDMFHFATSPAR